MSQFLENLKAWYSKPHMMPNKPYFAKIIAHIEKLESQLTEANRQIEARDKQIALLCDENRKIEGTRGYCCCGECDSDPLEETALAEANRRIKELQNVILQRDSDADIYGSAFVLAAVENGEVKFKNIHPEDVLIKPTTSKRGG